MPPPWSAGRLGDNHHRLANADPRSAPGAELRRALSTTACAVVSAAMTYAWPGEPAAATRHWRIGLLLFCLFCGGMRLWAIANIEPSIVPAAAGGMGAKMRGPFDGPQWMVNVLSVEPESDLARRA